MEQHHQQQQITHRLREAFMHLLQKYNSYARAEPMDEWYWADEVWALMVVVEQGKKVNEEIKTGRKVYILHRYDV